MIKCQDCGASQYPGTLFCSECGRSLLEPPDKETATLPFAQRGRIPTTPPLVQQNLNPADGKKNLVFVIPSSRFRLKVVLQNEIHVGRVDVEAGITPELDLTDVQGVSHGVSREHAKIQLTEQGIVLLDLDSTNGTYLNNYRLSPQQAYLLHHGDEVQFGDLLVHVFVDEKSAA